MHECRVCLKEINHGGKCYGRTIDRTCLIFERDPRGQRLSMKGKLPIDFGDEIPKVGEEVKVTIGGIHKTIEVQQIKSVEWDKGKRGLQGVVLIISFWYWSDENGQLANKPKLSIVK